jgi:hypothetical protein
LIDPLPSNFSFFIDANLVLNTSLSIADILSFSISHL